jgi:hypothetical protein
LAGCKSGLESRIQIRIWQLRIRGLKT